MAADLARRGLGLLVVVLAVDHRGEAVAGVALDPLPDIEHRAAGGVDHDAANVAQSLEVAHRDAEGRDDDDVVGGDGGKIELAVDAVQKDDAHPRQVRVHMRIVDDLADQEQPPIGKLRARLVGVVHGAVDAVAEAEFLGETKGQPARDRADCHCARIDSTIAL